MSDATATPALVWEEPPPVGAGRPSTVFTDEIKAQLKENPRTWAKLPTKVNISTVTKLRGKNKDFEFTYRKDEEDADNPRQVFVWVQYVGHQLAPKVD